MHLPSALSFTVLLLTHSALSAPSPQDLADAAGQLAPKVAAANPTIASHRGPVTVTPPAAVPAMVHDTWDATPDPNKIPGASAIKGSVWNGVPTKMNLTAWAGTDCDGPYFVRENFLYNQNQTGYIGSVMFTRDLSETEFLDYGSYPPGTPGNPDPNTVYGACDHFLGTQVGYDGFLPQGNKCMQTGFPEATCWKLRKAFGGSGPNDNNGFNNMGDDNDAPGGKA